MPKRQEDLLRLAEALRFNMLEIINEAFTPTAEEIAKAKHILDEYEKADVQGGLGAIVIDDQMIDAALLGVEWRKLAIARKAGLA